MLFVFGPKKVVVVVAVEKSIVVALGEILVVLGLVKPDTELSTELEEPLANKPVELAKDILGKLFSEDGTLNAGLDADVAAEDIDVMNLIVVEMVFVVGKLIWATVVGDGIRLLIERSVPMKLSVDEVWVPDTTLVVIELINESDPAKLELSNEELDIVDIVEINNAVSDVTVLVALDRAAVCDWEMLMLLIELLWLEAESDVGNAVEPLSLVVLIRVIIEDWEVSIAGNEADRLDPVSEEEDERVYIAVNVAVEVDNDSVLPGKLMELVRETDGRVLPELEFVAKFEPVAKIVEDMLLIWTDEYADAATEDALGQLDPEVFDISFVDGME